MSSGDLLLISLLCAWISTVVAWWIVRRRTEAEHERSMHYVRLEYERELRRVAPHLYPPALELGAKFTAPMNGIVCVCKVVELDGLRPERGTIQILYKDVERREISE